MQTFLPYPNFGESAACLDNKRLGKQRVEVIQILNALASNSESKWKNHPAVKMWNGYESYLCAYGIEICNAWIKKGFKDTCKNRIILIYDKVLCELNIPLWFGKEEFHSSHRSNLLRKDPIYYGKYGWIEKPDQPYWWPTNNGFKGEKRWQM